eukprot:355969-Chlamydomonas_euryale.AAC.5
MAKAPIKPPAGRSVPCWGSGESNQSADWAGTNSLPSQCSGRLLTGRRSSCAQTWGTPNMHGALGCLNAA